MKITLHSKSYLQRLVWTFPLCKKACFTRLFLRRKLVMTSLCHAHCLLATVFWEDWFNTSMMEWGTNGTVWGRCHLSPPICFSFPSPPSNLFFIRRLQFHKLKDSPRSLARLPWRFLNAAPSVLQLSFTFPWFMLVHFNLLSMKKWTVALGGLKWVTLTGWFDESWHNSHKTR